MTRKGFKPLGYDVGGSGCPHHPNFIILDIEEPQREYAWRKVDFRQPGWATEFELHPLPVVRCTNAMRYLADPKNGSTTLTQQVVWDFIDEIVKLLKPGGVMYLLDWKDIILAARERFAKYAYAEVSNWYELVFEEITSADDLLGIPAECAMMVHHRHLWE